MRRIMNKNLLVMVLLLTMILSSVGLYASETITATKSNTNFEVDGDKIAFNAYLVGGNNYIKLRDIAMSLRGTSKEFAVWWDDGTKTISIESDNSYEPVGGELVDKGTGDKSAIRTNANINVNGVVIRFDTYMIENNAYFKLRDIAELFDFGVDWISATNTATVSTDLPYTQEVVQEVEQEAKIDLTELYGIDMNIIGSSMKRIDPNGNAKYESELSWTYDDVMVAGQSSAYTITYRILNMDIYQYLTLVNISNLPKR